MPSAGDTGCFKNYYIVLVQMFIEFFIKAKNVLVINSVVCNQQAVYKIKGN